MSAPAHDSAVETSNSQGVQLEGQRKVKRKKILGDVEN